jgi:hypothetical protein
VNLWSRDLSSRGFYVNGGFYLGRTPDVLRMLEWMLRCGESDDQRALGRFINEHPAECSLDTRCDIVGNVTGKSFHRFNFVENPFGASRGAIFGSPALFRPLYQPSGATPCFAHIPGSRMDLYVRMDFFGSRILGSGYVLLTPQEKLRELRRDKYAWVYGAALAFLLILLYFRPAFGVALAIVLCTSALVYARVLETLRG